MNILRILTLISIKSMCKEKDALSSSIIDQKRKMDNPMRVALFSCRTCEYICMTRKGIPYHTRFAIETQYIEDRKSNSNRR